MSQDLDELLESAREATRPPPEAHLRAMVDHALLAGRARHRRARERAFVALGLGISALAALALLALQLGRRPSDYELALPTGDRLLARSDVRFEVESEGPALRRIRLHDGAMLFDVAPLDGGAFEVVTADETVRVLGTVFVVEASTAGTSVRVYEGRVEVTSATDRRTLVAGESDRPELATPRSAALEPAGREAAARRARVVVAARPAAPVESARPAAIVENEVRPAEVARTTEVAGPVAPPSEPRRRPVRAPTEAAPEPEPSIEPAAAAPSEPAPSEPVEAPTPEAEAPTDRAREAREALARGDAAAALALVEAGPRDDPAAMLVEGDALRVLERHRSAARVYELVVDHPDAGAARAPAGYLAAELLSRRFGQHHHARDVLRRSGALETAALGERALALDVELSTAVGDLEQARAGARRYLERFPEGPRAHWMRARLGE